MKYLNKSTTLVLLVIGTTLLTGNASPLPFSPCLSLETTCNNTTTTRTPSNIDAIAAEDKSSDHLMNSSIMKRHFATNSILMKRTVDEEIDNSTMKDEPDTTTTTTDLTSSSDNDDHGNDTDDTASSRASKQNRKLPTEQFLSSCKNHPGKEDKLSMDTDHRKEQTQHSNPRNVLPPFRFMNIRDFEDIVPSDSVQVDETKESPFTHSENQKRKDSENIENDTLIKKQKSMKDKVGNMDKLSSLHDSQVENSKSKGILPSLRFINRNDFENIVSDLSDDDQDDKTEDDNSLLSDDISQESPDFKYSIPGLLCHCLLSNKSSEMDRACPHDCDSDMNQKPLDGTIEKKETSKNSSSYCSASSSSSQKGSPMYHSCDESESFGIQDTIQNTVSEDLDMIDDASSQMLNVESKIENSGEVGPIDKESVNPAQNQVDNHSDEVPPVISKSPRRSQQFSSSNQSVKKPLFWNKMK